MNEQDKELALRIVFEQWYGKNYSEHALKTWDEWHYKNLDTELAWQSWKEAHRHHAAKMEQEAASRDAEVRDCGSGDVAANAKLIAAAPDLLAAIEAMRVAGGAAEFQAAFDKAKKLAMVHNAEVTGGPLAARPVD